MKAIWYDTLKDIFVVTYGRMGHYHLNGVFYRVSETQEHPFYTINSLEKVHKWIYICDL